MDYEELIELLVIDLLLVGNAYWFKWRTNEKGQPLALYRLAADSSKVILVGPRPAWATSTPCPAPASASRPDPAERHDPLQALIHSPYYGLGIVQGGGRPLDLELA